MSSPPNSLPENGSATPVTAEDKRLKKAIALKDFAIARGITVSETILKLLNKAECLKAQEELTRYLCDQGVEIDRAISELTNFTYPTTGDSLIDLTDNKDEIDSFKKWLGVLLVAAVVGTAIGYVLLLSLADTLGKTTANIVLAISLGLLGAVMFQVFNIIGILKEKAFNIEDLYANKLRILVGPAIGLVVYLALTQGALPTKDKLPTSLQLLLPFLAGFSTKLTVGILEKLIQASMMAFGIDDKRADILVRQRRNQTTAGAVPPNDLRNPDDSSDSAGAQADSSTAAEGRGESKSRPVP